MRFFKEINNNIRVSKIENANIIGKKLENLNTQFSFIKTDTSLSKKPNVLKEIIKIFAGIDGNFIQNNYSKIAYENPFVDPEHLVKNTFEQFRFFGGFDGKLAKRLNAVFT